MKEWVSIVWTIRNWDITTCSLLDFLDAGLHSPKVRWVWKSLLWMLLLYCCCHFVWRNLLIVGFRSVCGILDLSRFRSMADLATVTIYHHFRHVFYTKACVPTDLLWISSCWLPTLSLPCDGVHGRTLLMSSFLFLQQCLVRLILMVFEMGVRWPYSCYLAGFCLQELLDIAHKILVQFHSIKYILFVNIFCW